MCAKKEVKKQELKKLSFGILVGSTIGFFAWSFVISMPQFKELFGG